MNNIVAISDEKTKKQTCGRGELEFSYLERNTSISHLYQQQPIKIMFPNVARGEVKQAVITNTAGGLVGGDNLSLSVVGKCGTSALILSQSAEKVYGSVNEVSTIKIDITAKEKTWLEYLPQETILFDGSRLDRKTKITAHNGARILAGEIIVFGRRGSGEKFSSGFLRDTWEVRDQQKLVWTDTLLLENNIKQILEHPACFDNMSATATIVLICEHSVDYLEYSRSLLQNHDVTIRAGVSVINGVLVIRLLGSEPLDLRRAFSTVWQNLRYHIANLPYMMPRLWQI